MRVCFSVGPKSPQLINILSKSADNVEFSTYTNVADMIKESTMRHIFFDRIVISENILRNTESDLQALNNYITEFSDNTKIVFVCQGNTSGNSEIFNSFFNSPLYTPVLVDSVTTTKLLEFVKSDITELKAKYYSLDVRAPKSVVSKYSEEEKNIKPNGGTKVEKKGFFKSLFGGKKNDSSKIENQNSIKEDSTNEGKGTKTVSQNSDEKGSPNTISDVAIGTVVGAGVSTLKNGIDGNMNFNSSSPVSVGAPNFNDEISYNDSEEDNLGLGDLGEQHIDTGFLDDDAESEIEEALRYLENSNNSESIRDEENAPIIESFKEVIETKTPSKISPVIEKPLPSRGSNGKVSKYRLVIGERGVGVTSYIIDSSVKNANKGKRVLILDLDYKKNGVLSYIDTNAFFSRECNSGINNIRVYNEDGVDVLSNGYGVGVSYNSIRNLLSSGVLGNYDIVFIDCPLDCIDCLSEDLVSLCMTMIKVGGNKGSLLSTIDSLTNRVYISPKVEDLLFKNSKLDIVNKTEYYAEDIHFVKNTCFFGRGDWSSKID